MFQSVFYVRLFTIFLSLYLIAGDDTTFKYYVSVDEANFFQAFINCQEGGADLAHVTTPEEADVLNETLFNYPRYDKEELFWLSGTNLPDTTSSDYYWFTGGSLANFTLWLPGNPTNVYEHCMTWVITKYNESGWVDYPCEYRLKYICQEPDV
ncbi:C-type lectin 37Db-like [Rhynchophorus ferrugineus]|uniref:C-type lectin domain-containing protein n=1 Tax=Rhynchophorus ferrugineus TaxID=354439 RepID=A0A834IX12_RHYFE|nr:hypothetical protein GWI33_004553 [Rhynchophorus ferrugineus]